MSSPPSPSRDRDGIGRRDMIAKSYCHSNINDSRAMKLSRCMPACPGATGCGYTTVFTHYECLTLHHRILTCQVWARGLGQGFAMGLDLYLTARFARDTEIAEEVIPISQILPEGHAYFSLPASQRQRKRKIISASSAPLR